MQQRIRYLFDSVKQLSVREADIDTNPDGEWEVGSTCWLSRLKNVERVCLYDAWESGRHDNPHLGPPIMIVHETHVIAGRRLELAALRRWSYRLHPRTAMTGILPTIADSEGLSSVAIEISESADWRAIPYDSSLSDEEDLDEICVQAGNASAYEWRGAGELMLIAAVNKVRLEGGDSSLFANLKRVDISGSHGLTLDDLTRLLAISPNLKQLRTAIHRAPESQIFETWLSAHADQLQEVNLQNADLAWLPRLINCRVVELRISDKKINLRDESSVVSATTKISITSRIRHLKIRIGKPPLDVNPITFAEFLISCSSKDTTFMFHVCSDAPAAIRWQSEVRSAFAAFTGRVHLVSDGWMDSLDCDHSDTTDSEAEM